MSFVAGLAILDTHLVAAGAAISPTITNVSQGERASMTRRIDYYVTAIGEPQKMGAHTTLTDWMFGVGINIRIYVPVPDRSETLAANIEADLYAIVVEILTRIIGDSKLGGNCTDMTVNDTEFGWLNMPGWLRVATIPLVLDFVEQIPIAP